MIRAQGALRRRGGVSVSASYLPVTCNSLITLFNGCGPMSSES